MSALASAVCLFLMLPNGKHLVKHVRKLGGTAHCQRVVDDARDVSRRLGLEEHLLDALLIDEAKLDPDAVSKGGSSVGISQLNRKGRYHRAWRNACRAVPSSCQWSAVLVGGMALKDALGACPTQTRAIGFYRSGHCISREKDANVVLIAEQLRSAA